MDEIRLTVPDQLATEAPAGKRSRLNTDWPQVGIGIVLLLGSCLIADGSGDAYWTHVLQMVSLYVAVSVFQNLLFVDCGQVAFGYGAIFGLAAYGIAMVSQIYGYPYWLGALAGIGAALLGGVLFALPALRVQGYYLGFVTLGAALVLPSMLVAFADYTHGNDGISVSNSALAGRLAIGVSPLTLLASGVACLSMVAHVLLRRGRLGRMMRVTAASPEVMLSLGTRPGMVRSIAFLIAACGTGVAGTLYPLVVGYVGPTSFGIDLSILFFFAVVVGGRGQVLGPLLGIWLLYLVPNVLLAQLTNYRLLIYGASAMLVMLVLPDGLVGSFEKRRLARQARTAQRLPADLWGLLEQAATVGAAEPAAASAGAAIQVRGGRKLFGRVAALDGVDITVAHGMIHAVVGANGSGKTSLLNVLSGFTRLNQGSLHCNGVDVGRIPPHRIARLGIGRTFQRPRMFPAMSLWENVLIGMDGRHASLALTEADHAVLRRLHAALRYGNAAWLPHGQRRLIEIARVILKGATILLLDEPAAGLSSTERRDFANLLRILRDRAGKTIVLVEHDLDLVWDVADWITIMDAGRVVADGTPAEVTADPAAKALFVGGRVA